MTLQTARRPASALALALLVSLAGPLRVLADESVIRVGTYDNSPKIFRNDTGQIEGFYARIVEAILSAAKLEYSFVHGTWSEGLERLGNGQIDVMVDVAYSEERERLYRFNEETVFINWGVVYVREGLRIESFPDLDGFTIAGMRGGIYSEGKLGFVALAEQFGIVVKYLPVEDYTQAFRAVREGRADAAVVNRLFGLEQGERWNLRQTTVVFNPIDLKFAFNKESPRAPGLIEVFDKGLKALKADSHSAYYSALEQYLPGFLERRSEIPAWLKIVLPAGLLILLTSLAFVSVLEMEIRKRRAVEAQLLCAKDAAEAANRAKSAFLANMSHEIRTPMNAVLGYSQILRSDPGLRSEQREYLDRIAGSGEHLLHIINEILDLSKIESGRIDLVERSFDLPAILDDAEAMTRPKADAKGLVLRTEKDGDLPRFVIGDEGKVRQILVNLLGNAVKFTRSGTVTMRAVADPEEPGDGGFRTIQVTVSDTGPGIEGSDLDRIFEPFEQAKAGSASREGTGLGLPISRKLARRMGGDVIVASVPGTGSVFTFTVSLKLGGQPSPPDLAREPGRSGRIRDVRQSHLVLVADDRESNRDILVRMLEPYGFRMIQAPDGREALRIFEERKPRIVLLDLLMPVMDGFEALRRMRALEADSGMERAAILAVTASALEEDRSRVLEAGADEFIRKPFRLDDLLEILGRFVEFDRSRGDDRPEAPRIDSPLSPEQLRASTDRLDAQTRDDLARATVLGDVGRIRELAKILEETAPEVSAAALRAADSFDFEPLRKALEREE